MATRLRRTIVWLRRDLRLDDNIALERATRESEEVVCAFVLDPVLLRSKRMGGPLVAFFFDSLDALRGDLRERGSDLALLEGEFATELATLAARLEADAVFFNEDYEPDALERERHVRAALTKRGIQVESFTDLVYYGPTEIRQANGEPYTVFTPYKRRWLERHAAEPRPPADARRALASRLARREIIGATRATPAPEDFGYTRSAEFPRGGEAHGRTSLTTFVKERLAAYAAQRNFPSVAGTSRISAHLRAGTLGVRRCVWSALEARERAGGSQTGYDTWISELIWRDFYQQILANFPQVAHEPFVEAARKIRWRESETDWHAWCEGRTGYPIVDAAMRQLNATGWMHNRLRMVVASFLTKDLLIDYRFGERYFERHLADGDLAANNGGWQWAASTGTDSAPYFRIFNPILQSRKFDPDGAFLRRWLPELAKLDERTIHEPWLPGPLEAEAYGIRLGRDYPERIVEHHEARERALATLAPVLGKARR
jgi:deoxyribodipyrimidine photo-lyase